MITDDTTVQFTAIVLNHMVQNHGARPLDDRQAEALAIYVNELQGKLDDALDERDSLLDRIENMEQHPKGCRCRECAVP